MNNEDVEFAKLKTKLEEHGTILVLFVILAIIIGMANCWYSEDSIRQEMMAANSYISEVKEFNRNFMDYSQITYVEKDKVLTCCLDTDIFGRHEFKECPLPRTDDFYSP